MRKENWLNAYGTPNSKYYKDLDDIEKAFRKVLEAYKDRVSFRTLRDVASLAASGAVDKLIIDKFNQEDQYA